MAIFGVEIRGRGRIGGKGAVEGVVFGSVIGLCTQRVRAGNNADVWGIRFEFHERVPSNMSKDRASRGV